MAEFSDLNGLWSGWYAYSALSERVAFTAWIDDTSAILTGSIMEPNTLSAFNIDDLQADISGTRTGRQVNFVKIYGERQGAHGYPISYVGETTPDFQCVDGTWSFANPALGAGLFEMVRASRGVSEGVLREVMVSVGNH